MSCWQAARARREMGRRTQIPRAVRRSNWRRRTDRRQGRDGGGRSDRSRWRYVSDKRRIVRHTIAERPRQRRWTKRRRRALVCGRSGHHAEGSRSIRTPRGHHRRRHNTRRRREHRRDLQGKVVGEWGGHWLRYRNVGHDCHTRLLGANLLNDGSKCSRRLDRCGLVEDLLRRRNVVR